MTSWTYIWQSNKVAEAWVSYIMEHHTRRTYSLQEKEMKESRFPNYKESEKEERERERELAIRKCKFPKFFWVIKGCVWREREIFH